MPVEMQKLEALNRLLNSPKNIVIITHQKPDADALGSSIGLSLYLKQIGHPVKVVSPTDYPAFLNWMPENNEVVIFESKDQQQAVDLIKAAEIIFCLDFSSLERINNLGQIVRATSALKVLIDHHLEPEPFADFEFSDTSAAATAEIVFDIIKESGNLGMIDTRMANCLYAGIMTDTGGFRNANTSRKSHLVAADLISQGADVPSINKLVYDNNTADRLKFTGFALSQRLVVIKELRTAYFSISRSDMEQFNSKTGDTEGLVNYALSIEGTVLAALITGHGDGVRLSFRSVGNFSVNEFARKHFNGGGHKNAAGGTSDLSLDDTATKFRELLVEYRDQLHNCELITAT